MQQTVVPGVAMWSVWQADRNLYFNSFFIETPHGNLVVDPLRVDDADASEIAARGGIACIAITNRDHERDARALAARFEAKLAASEGDAPLLAGPLDRTLREEDDVLGARVIPLAGFKTAGEIGLHLPERRTVVLGDALWGSPAGALRLMPDEKLGDPVRAALSLRHVAALHPEHLLVGDGACIFGDAAKAIWRCLEARALPGMHRVNRDEAVWRVWGDDPQLYANSAFEIGDIIGAQKLGYRLTRLPPKTASCPLHWHAAEEELFVVLAGAATLVTPGGEIAIRTGDYIAFPTRASGAHKIVNSADEPCEILMIANTDPGDVCYYPDSHKVLVEAADLMVRDNPTLDYWDGE